MNCTMISEFSRVSFHFVSRTETGLRKNECTSNDIIQTLILMKGIEEGWNNFQTNKNNFTRKKKHIGTKRNYSIISLFDFLSIWILEILLLQMLQNQQHSGPVFEIYVIDESVVQTQYPQQQQTYTSTFLVPTLSNSLNVSTVPSPHRS